MGKQLAPKISHVGIRAVERRPDSHMQRQLAPKIWSLISPTVAQRFRVIPLRREGNTTRLILGKKVSEKQRQKTEALLAFCLGTKVHLDTLESHPELEMGGFNEILDRYYSAAPAQILTEPVATDLMTVLVVDAEVSRGREIADEIGHHGFNAVHKKDLSAAVEFARQRSRTLGKVLIADDFPGGLKRAIRVLAGATRAEVEAMNGVLSKRDPYGQLLADMKELVLRSAHHSLAAAH